MLLDQINLNQLRIFECVYRNRSMTLAADELHLTQSGVSQHIGALETVLDTKLFDRLRQRLVPTSVAKRLFEHCFEALNRVEEALSEIKGGEQSLSGLVSIGVPIEFGNNVVIPILSEFCQAHPRIKLALVYGFASEMNEQLLNGALDFAFIDQFAMDRQIRVEPLYDELLVLVASQRLFNRMGLEVPPGLAKQSRKEQLLFFQALEYIDYQPGEPILRKWFRHHLSSKNPTLNSRASMMDVQGVSRAILGGLGAGVLPGYVVEQLRRRDDSILLFEGSGEMLHNKISIADLPTRSLSQGAQKLRQFCLEKIRPQNRKATK